MDRDVYIRWCGAEGEEGVLRGCYFGVEDGGNGFEPMGVD